MPINPVQFAHGVCDEFLRYLFSAFPLSDPELAEQARKLLERPSSLDIPLVKGPFVSLSEAFAKGELVQKLADQGILHHAMPGLIGYPTMWKHQQQVFEAVKTGNHVLVSTGTGSGKTEAFLYPIVDDLLRQRDKGITSGLTAILIYPMNALANDQLDRLRDMLGGTGITFGQWVGTTPELKTMSRWTAFEGPGGQAYPGRPPEAPRRGPGRGPGRAPPGPTGRVLLRGGHPGAQAPHPADELPAARSADHPLAGRGALRRGPAQVPRL